MIHVITGASGLLGRHLVKALLARNERVIALSRSAEAFFENESCSNLTAINLDLSLEGCIFPSIPDEPCTLTMLASRITTSKDVSEISPIVAIDTFGHLRLIEHLGNRLTMGVYTSSSTIYGFPQHLPVKEIDPLEPWNAYAIAKATGEAAIGYYLAQESVPLSILRVTQVYGTGAEDSGAMYTFIRCAAEGSPLTITVNPDSYRDYVHVDDVTRAILAALDRRIDGKFNIGSGTKTSFVQLARFALKATDSNFEPEITHIDSTFSMQLDITKARLHLDYIPEVTPENGIKIETKRLFPSRFTE